MKKLAILLISMLMLGLILGVISCGGKEVGQLDIENTGCSMSGVALYEITDAPRNEDGYIQLHDFKAVKLPGPEIIPSSGTAVGGLFVLSNEQINEFGIHIHSGGDRHWDGYNVIVNSHLIYNIIGSDYEGEICLARVDLTRDGDKIKSSFIFVALPEGSGTVAITIKAIVDGNVIGMSSPVAIRVN